MTNLVSPLPRWGAAVVLGVLAVIVGALIVVSTPAWRHRNKGDDTTCPDFLTMSHSQQLAVIRTIGFDTAYTTPEAQRRTAAAGCRNQRSDTTVGDALGP